MVEYWVVKDKKGAPSTSPTTEEVAEKNRETLDLLAPDVAPHRVVHLVESGTQDVCWHCHDALEPQGRPHCHSCPAAVRMFGYREHRRTPSWCQLRAAAVGAFLDWAERNKRIWDTVEEDDD